MLADGLGQCNTKGTLLMALLRAVGIPCRLHGFTIHNELQKGAIPGWILALASDEILHSWVEVYVAGEWHDLEGFILDRRYLTAIQRRFPAATGSFCGYGIATTDFRPRRSSGPAETPTSSGRGSPGTSAGTTVRMTSTPPTAPTCEDSGGSPTSTPPGTSSTATSPGCGGRPWGTGEGSAR